MKLFVAALTLAFSISSFGQDILQGFISKKFTVDEAPSFFFKVNGDGSMISYTIPAPGRKPIEPGKNKLLDTNTGVTTDIPGPHDPVFIGDLNLLIIPTISHSQYQIYRINDLLKNFTNPIASIKSLKGFYQSAGVLGKNPQYTFIRVIAERSAMAHSIIDMKYSTGGRIYLDDSRERILCPTTNFKLPMLSKNGKFVAGLDIFTNTSGVWKILDNYECEKVADLGLKTGKLNFNYDNTKLTYHLYRPLESGNTDTSTDYVPLPEATNVADIFVYDMETGTHTQMTKNLTANSMYPDFLRDGSLVFVNHPHSKEERVSFVFLNP